MKNGIYILFNTLTNRYERTFESPTDKSASLAFKESSSMIPNNEYLEICHIADVEVETGLVTPLSAPLRVEKMKAEDSEPLINQIEKKSE